MNSRCRDDGQCSSGQAFPGALRAALLVLGLTAAVSVRVAIAGPAAAQSSSAGLAFAACLLLLVVLAGFRPARPTGRDFGIGIGGAALLCLPALLGRWAAGHVVGLPFAAFPRWATVVTVVAVAEELLLRGVLYDVLSRWHGQAIATVLTATAFALLHVPVYGAHVLPLDLSVGLVLGALRGVSDTVAAPALAHTLADLAGWWLR